jgi:hypothetical protein
VGANDFRISDMGPNGNGNYNAWLPALAYNNTDNEYLVVWFGDDNTPPLTDGQQEIFGQRLDAATGTQVGANDFRISDMGPDGDSSYGAFSPAVAYNSINNQYLVVWYGDDSTAPLVDEEFEIFGQRLNAATGAQVGANDFRISDMGPEGSISYDASSPTVAYNRTNNEYLVVWQGDDNAPPLVDEEFEIFGQRLNAATGAQVGANDFRISDMGPDGDVKYGVLDLALAYNGANNEYLVVWYGYDNTPPLDRELEIFGQRLDAATGVQVGLNDFRISDMGPDGQKNYYAAYPAVAYNSGNNQYLTAWEGSDNTPPLVAFEKEIFGQRLEYAPPTVTLVNSVAGTGDGVLAEGEATTAAITQLLVSFSKSMRNPAGDTGANDVTNPANYRLFSSGADGAFQTGACGAAQGDDGTVAINAVSYNSDTRTASLTVNGGARLPPAGYRLLACGTLHDLDSTPLDGNDDGISGDAFPRTFVVLNTPPSISAIADRSIPENSSTPAIPFAIGDAETAAASLIVSASSSNTTLVPNANIVFGGAGANHTLTVTPAADRRGSAMITVRVSDGIATSSTNFVLTVTPSPWLALLYLAGDDIEPTGAGGLRVSLSEPLKRLLLRLDTMPYNPNVRVVVLYDGNLADDSRLMVRAPGGLQDVAARPFWFPAGQKELDTGSVSTLSAFISWARATYPGSPYSFLSIVDHGGGWAPDLGDIGQPRTGGGVQAGGWRGMSLDLTSPGGTSLSTLDTSDALALALGTERFDVVFFDACLMGMIESAYQVHPYASYLVAGENLLWAQLPYESYFAPTLLNSTTTPKQLAVSMVESYNQTAPSNPFTIAALDTTRLPDLASKTNTLASRLLAALPGGASPVAGAEARIRAAYAEAQKFDYDNSLTIDSTDGYVDLADFARQLLLPATAISNEVSAAAQAIVEATGGRGEANRVVVGFKARSGTVRTPSGLHTWDFTDSYGLAIYLPLGEQDMRPTGPPTTPDGPATPERQLDYYTDPDQLAFTRDAPKWAELLVRLEGNTPPRDAGRGAYRAPFPVSKISIYLPLVRR